ncbi:hypothetical protein KSP40_PGU017171 [Platanthera guangdongensis]|uniref:Uncharacterized protein n=1 Tax=Platanthera guangdongensis TaxID=2320717 RepID=A0ABR2LDK7_9ASPA
MPAQLRTKVGSARYKGSAADANAGVARRRQSEDSSKVETSGNKGATKTRYHAQMPPELLVHIDLPLDVLKSFYLLPSLMYRMESLMLASQLRKEIDLSSSSFLVPSALKKKKQTSRGKIGDESPNPKANLEIEGGRTMASISSRLSDSARRLFNENEELGNHTRTKRQNNATARPKNLTGGGCGWAKEEYLCEGGRTTTGFPQRRREDAERRVADGAPLLLPPA